MDYDVIGDTVACRPVSLSRIKIPFVRKKVNDVSNNLFFFPSLFMNCITNLAVLFCCLRAGYINVILWFSFSEEVYSYVRSFPLTCCRYNLFFHL